MPATLALFDLDNTLIKGDSDHAWGEFLAQKGLVDAAAYRRTNDRFYRDYVEGRLDMHAYLAFALEPLARHEESELERHREEFVQTVIRPLVLPKALDLVHTHRERGDFTLIITSTNRFVTQPIAALFGVEELIATEAQRLEGRYTGRPEGTPAYREGKVARLRAWMEATGHALEGSTFYSDSHNDLPLLELVEHPVAVDPDDTLRAHARERGWPVLSLR